MRAEDVAAAQELSGLAFAALPSMPADQDSPHPRGAGSSERWQRRARHLLATDPGGCWAAMSDDGTLIGVATSLRRDGLWGLSTLAVRPGSQDRGAGRALMERATAYGSGALRGMICSSHDPRAVRLYHVFGHQVHPTMGFRGVPDRAMLPAIRHVREGSASDVEFADSVDRVVRGAPHGPDHVWMVGDNPMLIAETASGRGYCYLRDQTEPWLLAATDTATARELLWAALAQVPERNSVTVNDVTAEQRWAVDVAVAAGLSIVPGGFLCIRGMRPPSPYVPSGAFL
jgi:hypothetical protein